MLRAFFSPEVAKKKKNHLFLIAEGEKLFGHLSLFAVVQKHLYLAIRRRLLFFVRHLSLFAVAEKSLKGACRYSVFAAIFV